MKALPWLAFALLAAAVAAAYAGSLGGVFVMDDLPAIVDNRALRRGSAQALLPPAGSGDTGAGRPVLNLTLALNYAAGGLAPRGYHLVNLGIHLAAALALLGILRRLGSGLGFAFGASLLWAVHPLNTEAVTYVVQRAESLMGLFYLLTLYAFVRAAAGGSARPARWYALSVLACLLGMGTKEVMVSAPLLVLCLDRLRFAGSFAAAWRRRRAYYAALAATWIPLAALVWREGSRGGTSGFGLAVSARRYWATQPAAIARYLRLAFWPHPLVFDYGTQWLARRSDLLLPGALIAALAGIGAWGLWRKRDWGLLVLAFFAVLAPTSLVPGGRQTAAEHRMYLALVPVVVLALGAAGRGLRRLGEREAGAALAAGALLLALPLGAATAARNADYASALRLWSDNVARVPDSPQAQNNYGSALAAAGRYGEAEQRFREALRLDPGASLAEENLGKLALRFGRPAEAERHFARAAALRPGRAAAHEGLAEAYLGEGRRPEARAELERAVALDAGDEFAADELRRLGPGAP
ncbi:MAG TPA: tetratricopeptide repeat protein [Opitutaceae bacterium]|nr:tetratricopeptide repeat protein [Opitutaceae bacterium]